MWLAVTSNLSSIQNPLSCQSHHPCKGGPAFRPKPKSMNHNLAQPAPSLSLGVLSTLRPASGRGRHVSHRPQGRLRHALRRP